MDILFKVYLAAADHSEIACEVQVQVGLAAERDNPL
jgi:hypothetical protein